jgi:bacterial/archaeal transporter family-2 protein
MHPIWLLLPVLLGISGVFQNGLNRHLMIHWNLNSAVFFNNIVVLTVGLGVWALCYALSDHTPQILSPKAAFTRFEWWYFLPGILGLFFVIGTPYAIFKLGALKVFVLLVATQIVVSLIWDTLSEGRGLSPLRLSGAALALIGAVIVALDND